MKIVIAPNPFKNCVDGNTVCALIQQGLRRVWPNALYAKVPMADGGDGTLDALVAATQGRIIETTVKDPLARDITARFGILGDGATAVIEIAEASGLRLVPLSHLNPMLANPMEPDS